MRYSPGEAASPVTSWSFASGVPISSGSNPADGLLPGATLGAWTVLGPLGEGGMARVYRARGPRGELAALKVLAQPVDAEQRARFQREGQLARRLQHPGLVPLLDGGEVEGVPFLAYELVEGGPSFLRRLAGVGLRERVELLRDVARAVGAAHGQGVVHRDLKPDNVLIDAHGRPRVTDFGLALVEGLDRLTRSGAVVGTPLWMAPEQTDPERREVGPPADVWSLGVMLYQALTGKHPFPGQSWLELRRLVQAGRPPGPRTVTPQVTPLLEAVCLRALEVAPAQRFPHGEALAGALDAALAAGLPGGPGSAPPLPVEPDASAPSWARGPQQLGRKGRFELRGVLGRGGMGVVYLAWDPELHREVALKLVMAARGSTRLERFRREAEVTASLAHPGILAVHSVGVLEETPYIVYELVPGARTLREAAPELDPTRRVELVRDAARALAYAHERGVIHRDVKPENLLVDAELRLRVADFGLAAAEGQGRLTHTGAMVGTPHYMAPELIAGDREQVGPHTDVWALGVVLFELVCGRLPFLADDMVELATRVINQATPSPRELAPQLDRRLEAICLRALAKERAQRYRHAGELADDLDAFLAGRPLSGSTTSMGAGWTPARRRLLLAGAGCALGVGLIATTWWLTAGTPSAGEAPPPASPTSGAPSTSPAPGSPAWVEAGSQAWRAVRRELDREEGMGELRRWLERWPEHPQAEEARALLARLRLERPSMVIKTGRGQGRAVFLDASRLLVWTKDGTVGVWDVVHQTCESLAVAPRPLVRVLPTPGGWVVGGQEALVHLGPDGRLESEPPPVNWLDMTRDGRLVASTWLDVRLFDATTGQLVRRVEGFQTEADVVAFSPDGSLFAACGGPGTLGNGESLLGVWETRSGERRVWTRTRATGRALAWTPDGAVLIMGTNAGQIYLLDPATGDVQHELRTSSRAEGDRGLLQPVAHLGTVRGLALTRDGKRLYSVGRGDELLTNQLKVWDLEAQQELRSADKRPVRYDSLSLSADERWLAVGSEEGRVEVWAAE